MLTFSDGTTLRKINKTTWEEISSETSFLFRELSCECGTIVLRDDGRNVDAKIDGDGRYWIRFPGVDWYIYKKKVATKAVSTITFPKFVINNAIKAQHIPGPKSICIVTLGTPNMRDMLDLSQANQKQYASIHGYNYIWYDDSLINTKWVTWNKLCVLQRHLQDYEWVMWIDSDAVFTNIDTTIESILEHAGESSLLVCDDIGGWRLNSGVMFWKNTEWSLTALSELHDMEKIPHSSGAEQQQLIKLLEKKRNGYKIFPRKLFNQHPDEHETGDYILHMMGKSGDERIKRFKKINDTIL